MVLGVILGALQKKLISQQIGVLFQASERISILQLSINLQL